MLFKKFEWPEVDFSSLKQRTRILVIDDGPFAYKEIFAQNNYAIDKWENIKDISLLENGYYDIILLDVQGVGLEYSKDQGLGILKHIKEVSPAQIVIAYSNSDYGLKFQEFFDLADGVLSKSEDYIVFKRKVDDLIKLRFSEDYGLDVLRKKYPTDFPIEKTKKAIQKSIKRNDRNYIIKALGTIDKEKISFALNVVGFIIQTYAAINGIVKP